MNYIIIFLAIVTGYLLSRFIEKNKSYLSHVILFSLGVLGLLYFLNILIWNNADPYRFAFIYLLIAVSLFVFLKRGGSKIFVPVHFHFFDFLTLAIIFLIAKHQPYGWWDAWALWNTKAKFLVSGGENWQRMFSSSIEWMHPDYPLLVPSIVASGWSFFQTNSCWIPIAVTVIFSWSLYLLLKENINFLFQNNKMSAFIGFFLIAIPAFLRWGRSQYADLPLAAFLLLSITLFFRYKKVSTFLLSGLSLGLVAFTKNEGVFYAAIFILSAALALFYTRGRNLKKEMLVAWFSGLAPGIIFLAIVKKMSPINNLFLLNFDNIAPHSWHRILDIISGFLNEFSRWKEWAIFWPIALAFLIIGLLNINEKDYWNVFLLIFLMVSFIFYFSVYIFVPLKYDISWYIDTSLNRLLIQITPIFVFYIAFWLKNLFYKKTTS